MADKSYLNVKYDVFSTTINMKDVGDISDLQDKIKIEFGIWE